MNDFQTSNNFITLTDEELGNIIGGFNWSWLFAGLFEPDPILPF